MKPRHAFVFVPLVLALLTALPAAAATTITVTNANDNGPGSLRNAISLAVSGDTINFSLPSYPATITLTSGTLTIGTSLTIDGPGASNLSISQSQSGGVMAVSSGATVSLSDLTIENGGAYRGGGISNDGTLTLAGVTVTNNSAYFDGGGIFNDGTLTINDSTVSKNTVTYYGGGIYTKGGTLTIDGSTVSGNASSYIAGGIYSSNGKAALTNSTVSGNSAPTAGGIYNDSQATLTLTGSTVSGNSATTDGGGIYNSFYSQATLTNSTLSGNSSGRDGGAILNYLSASLTLGNATISGNSARSGGGLYNSSATLLLKGTIVANSSGGNCSVSGGAPTTDGYNLSDDGTCSSFLDSVTDRNASPAGLSTDGLQDNGGPTKTVALLSTSTAVDAIPDADCTLTDETTSLATDQRAVKRPQGAACDVGAFELVESVPFSSFTAKLDISGDPGFDLNSKFTLGDGSAGINPITEVVKLQVGPYLATIPPDSFHQLKKGAKQGSYVFSGIVDGASLSIQIVPLGGNSYQFKASGSPVDFTAVTNPVTVTLSFGQDTGTTLTTADF